MRTPSFLPALLATLAVSAAAADARAQCVSLTTPGVPYTQNFDTLSNTAGSTTNNLAITGWFMTETGGGARDNEQYAVDTGGSVTGDTYSYGAAASTERALGALQTGTLIPAFGACFTNNTGATLSQVAVSYRGEQWRLGTAARTDRLDFEHSTNATSLTTGTWTGVTGLNFTSPNIATTTGALDGNNSANSANLAANVSLNVPNGATFWIRWLDFNASAADDGLAVDDFSLTPQGGPSTLTINDVTAAEGNSGTTQFQFTVALSLPAGPGGVTFDIATANNTATAPGDFTAQSLSGQSIPAGSSTYTFTVLVNGDTTQEPNETFFVNVTNITGANAADAQGQGTITNDDVAADTSVTVTVTTAMPTAGADVAMTYAVSNAGPGAAAGVVFTRAINAPETFRSLAAPAGWSCITPAVDDTGVVSCTLSSMASGYAEQVVLTTRLAPDEENSFPVVATLSSTTADPATGNNTAVTILAPVTSADLSVSGSWGAFVAGSATSATFTVTNAGPSQAASPILAFTLPAGITLVQVTGGTGWTCTTDMDAVVCTRSVFQGTSELVLQLATDPSLADGGMPMITAVLNATTDDPDTSNNTAAATGMVMAMVDLSITATADPSPAVAGSSLRYALTVANSGPSRAGTLILAIALSAFTHFAGLVAPAGWNCTTPAVGAMGGSVECSSTTLGLEMTSLALDVTVDAGATDGSSLVLNAALFSTVTDTAPANNTATLLTTVSASADLSITHAATPDPVLTGELVTHALQATNLGAANAGFVTVMHALATGTTFNALTAPGGWSCTTPAVGAHGSVTCTGALSAGASAAFELSARADTALARGTTLTSTASISSMLMDPVMTNNTAVATTTVAVLPAQLGLTKKVSGTFTPGGTVNYTLVLSNTGMRNHDDNAGADEVADVLPEQLQLVSASADSGTAMADAASRRITWNGVVAVGSSVNIQVTATILPGTAAGTSISNQAEAKVDVEGDGTAETSVRSDDPMPTGDEDPTVFVVETGMGTPSSAGGGSSTAGGSSTSGDASSGTVNSSGVTASSSAGSPSSGAAASSTADVSSGPVASSSAGPSSAAETSSSAPVASSGLPASSSSSSRPSSSSVALSSSGASLSSGGASGSGTMAASSTDGTGDENEGGGCACDAPGGTPLDAAPWMALAGMVLLAARRRRAG